MRSVNIADLKNRLSTYLSYAKSGEEVIIRDRNLPVAKLVPFTSENATEEELLLVAQGKLRLPTKPFNPQAFLKKRKSRAEAANVKLRDAVEAVRAERDEGY